MLEKIFSSLQNGAFVKIICGAANTSEKQVEKISLVYSLCGVDVIDISPYKNIYNAAKRRIAKALDITGRNPGIYPKFRVPAIMKSINIGDDKHFRKASLNLDKCVQCLECVKVCQSNALTFKGEKINFDSDKCYGCARCAEVCRQNAISLTDIPHNPHDDTGNFDAVEIHTGNSSIEEIKTFLESNKNIMEKAGLVSVSVDSKRFNSVDLVDYVNSVIKMFDKKIIIQIDGNSMRGGTENSSTMQTIAAAAMLLDAKADAYIQLSGGTNHLTREIVDLTGLKLSGIGYGSFARKIILPYLEEDKEDEFMTNLRKITNIAESFIKI